MLTKETVKNIIIFVLIIILAVFVKNTMQMNSIIKNSATSNLYYFRNEIIKLNVELSKHENMTLDELRSILKESEKSGILHCAAITYSYSQKKQLNYIDIGFFNHYIGFLIGCELPENELDFHKNNIEKICTLCENISVDNDIFYPTNDLKEICKKTNNLSLEGIKRIEEFRIAEQDS